MDTKDRLLTALKERKGHWVSGEVLSQHLAVSRSAVWKNIGKLRKAGYVIRAARKKGYCLLRIPDLLLPAEIRDGLKTRCFGQGEIAHFMEIGSTNTTAKQMAVQGATEGTVVVAEHQTHGRGRKHRGWFSPASGGIYCSLILRPRISPADSPRITFLSAVSAAEALCRVTPLHPTIKWPNDILIRGKKVAGILTEMASDMDSVSYGVVGIGINVNTSDFPDIIADTATSVFRETQQPLSRTALVQAYLEEQEKWYGVLKRQGFEPVLERWRTMANIIGKPIRVEMIDKRIEGRVQMIDADGVLILGDKRGQTHRILSGDVFFL